MAAAEQGAPEALAALASQRLRLLLVAPRDLTHWAFRTLLTQQPWVQQLATAHAIEEGLVLARRYRPHLAIVDYELLGGLAAELAERLRSDSPATRVLLLTRDLDSARSAASIEADGTVPKSWSGRDIAAAARTVGLGLGVSAPEAEPPRSLLTTRELEVLQMMAGGSTNREIAAALELSPHTVKDHTTSLYRKLDARNRAEAIVRAQRLGLMA